MSSSKRSGRIGEYLIHDIPAYPGSTTSDGRIVAEGRRRQLQADEHNQATLRAIDRGTDQLKGIFQAERIGRDELLRRQDAVLGVMGRIANGISGVGGFLDDAAQRLNRIAEINQSGFNNVSGAVNDLGHQVDGLRRVTASGLRSVAGPSLEKYDVQTLINHGGHPALLRAYKERRLSPAAADDVESVSTEFLRGLSRSVNILGGSPADYSWGSYLHNPSSFLRIGYQQGTEVLEAMRADSDAPNIFGLDSFIRAAEMLLEQVRLSEEQVLSESDLIELARNELLTGGEHHRLMQRSRASRQSGGIAGTNHHLNDLLIQAERAGRQRDRASAQLDRISDTIEASAMRAEVQREKGLGLSQAAIALSTAQLVAQHSIAAGVEDLVALGEHAAEQREQQLAVGIASVEAVENVGENVRNASRINRLQLAAVIEELNAGNELGIELNQLVRLLTAQIITSSVEQVSATDNATDVLSGDIHELIDQSKAVATGTHARLDTLIGLEVNRLHRDAQHYLTEGTKVLERAQSEDMYELAITAFKRAVEHAPAAAVIHFQLARAYEGANQMQEAILAYKRVGQLAENTHAMMAAYALERAAELELEMELLDDAIQSMVSSLSFTPDNLRIRWKLANALQKKGDLEAAKELTLDMLKVSPELLFHVGNEIKNEELKGIIYDEFWTSIGTQDTRLLIHLIARLLEFNNPVLSEVVLQLIECEPRHVSILEDDIFKPYINQIAKLLYSKQSLNDPQVLCFLFEHFAAKDDPRIKHLIAALLEQDPRHLPRLIVAEISDELRHEVSIFLWDNNPTNSRDVAIMRYLFNDLLDNEDSRLKEVYLALFLQDSNHFTLIHDGRVDEDKKTELLSMLWAHQSSWIDSSCAEIILDEIFEHFKERDPRLAANEFVELCRINPERVQLLNEEGLDPHLVSLICDRLWNSNIEAANQVLDRILESFLFRLDPRRHEVARKMIGLDPNSIYEFKKLRISEPSLNQLLEDVWDQGLSESSVVLSYLLHHFSEKRDVKRAVAVFQRKMHMNPSILMYLSLFARNQEVYDAICEAIWRNVPSSEPRALEYLFEHFHQLGDEEKFVILLGRLIEAEHSKLDLLEQKSLTEEQINRVCDELWRRVRFDVIGPHSVLRFVFRNFVSRSDERAIPAFLILYGISPSHSLKLLDDVPEELLGPIYDHIWKSDPKNSAITLEYIFYYFCKKNDERAVSAFINLIRINPEKIFFLRDDPFNLNRFNLRIPKAISAKIFHQILAQGLHSNPTICKLAFDYYLLNDDLTAAYVFVALILQDPSMMHIADKKSEKHPDIFAKVFDLILKYVDRIPLNVLHSAFEYFSKQSNLESSALLLGLYVTRGGDPSSLLDFAKTHHQLMHELCIYLWIHRELDPEIKWIDSQHAGIILKAIFLDFIQTDIQTASLVFLELMNKNSGRTDLLSEQELQELDESQVFSLARAVASKLLERPKALLNRFRFIRLDPVINKAIMDQLVNELIREAHTIATSKTNFILKWNQGLIGKRVIGERVLERILINPELIRILGFQAFTALDNLICSDPQYFSLILNPNVPSVFLERLMKRKIIRGEVLLIMYEAMLARRMEDHAAIVLNRLLQLKPLFVRKVQTLEIPESVFQSLCRLMSKNLNNYDEKTLFWSFDRLQDSGNEKVYVLFYLELIKRDFSKFFHLVLTIKDERIKRQAYSGICDLILDNNDVSFFQLMNLNGQRIGRSQFSLPTDLARYFEERLRTTTERADPKYAPHFSGDKRFHKVAKKQIERFELGLSRESYILRSDAGQSSFAAIYHESIWENRGYHREKVRAFSGKYYRGQEGLKAVWKSVLL